MVNMTVRKSDFQRIVRETAIAAKGLCSNMCETRNATSRVQARVGDRSNRSNPSVLLALVREVEGTEEGRDEVDGKGEAQQCESLRMIRDRL